MQLIPSAVAWLRRSIHDRRSLQWHLELVDDKLSLSGQEQSNPAKTSAIFVVHGMGEQAPAETAAVLRSGFDDALADIQEWQTGQKLQIIPQDFVVPPPYIRDGFWGDYPRIDQTFPEEWKRFSPGQQQFFAKLWQVRTQSPFRVFRWAVRQLMRLLSPRVIGELGLIAWCIYLPLQVMAFVTLLLSLIKAPRILTGFLGDVRLYLDPNGVTERAVVQRIDERVANSFMRLIGQDFNFKSLPRPAYYKSCGRTVCFDRVVWVAHSLGSVISYNVLSDLFCKAEQIEAEHLKDPTLLAEEYQNVLHFRRCLCRFVTIGSPLDKAAYLYHRRALTPWPEKSRASLLGTKDNGQPSRWWVNFYSLLDPVSGPLNSGLLFGDTPPMNFHVVSSILPGYAHIGYWRDSTVLRYLLGRTYGPKLLRDRSLNPWPAPLLALLALGFHVLNFVLAILVLVVVIWFILYVLDLYNDNLYTWARMLFEWIF